MPDVDLLIKLFDTLKDSSKDTHIMCQAMLTNQNNIGNYIKNLPMESLVNALKDHSKNSKDEIGSCTQTVETKSDDILAEVTSIKGKIKTMIMVVVVAFALFSIASLIGVITYNIRQSVDNPPVELYDAKKAEQQHEDLKSEIIDLLREELKFHNKETKELIENK